MRKIENINKKPVKMCIILQYTEKFETKKQNFDDHAEKLGQYISVVK